MKQVISVRDLEEMLRSGKDVRSLPDDALITPSARDFLRELDGPGAYRTISPEPASLASAKPITSKSGKAEIDAYFNSPRINELKSQICDIGRRLWQRAYVDGNGGNIAIRVGEDIALCTPTLVSKGFMKEGGTRIEIHPSRKGSEVTWVTKYTLPYSYLGRLVDKLRAGKMFDKAIEDSVKNLKELLER